MGVDMIQEPLSNVLPSYRIKRYTDQIYKVVHFKYADFISPFEKINMHTEEHQTYDIKLDASFSRARRVLLEIALCNSWDYFVTFTLDPAKYNRSDLVAFKKDISQFVRDQRKKWKCEIKYCFVPEQHKDGAWHMHGLMNCPKEILTSFYYCRMHGMNVPDRLVDHKYLNWVDFQHKFGFCSFSQIDNPVACAFYIQKYLSKSMDESGVSVKQHLYLCSTGLNRAMEHGEVYGSCSYLNQFLTNHYEFIETGLTTVQDGLDWTFAFDRMELQAFGDSAEDVENQAAVDLYMEDMEQLSFV